MIAAAGRRNGFINRSFTSTTLYSFTGGEDKGRGAKNDDIGSRDAARDVGYMRHFSKDCERQYARSLYVLVHTICAVKVFAFVLLSLHSNNLLTI